ncbi:hypothetical protein K443DRAFT_396017 [Laccaria amethystina LaAM-08-1]|uniref:Uncharacterized protein n=1 Tax=Laccaria amethystina LaAM-08-1 TaxID=1095629 RepID=A0A0C9X7I2_9AGAR|nr:hypothetical protein K443DRAFT_396017 [Laccaria amethystina LaAM-08-1]
MAGETGLRPLLLFRPVGRKLIPATVTITPHRQPGPIRPHRILTIPSTISEFAISTSKRATSSFQSSNGGLAVVSLLHCWQYAFITPVSPLTAFLQRMQKHSDPFSGSTTPPLLSSNADDLPRAKATQSYMKRQHRRRLVNYHCHKGTKINSALANLYVNPPTFIPARG